MSLDIKEQITIAMEDLKSLNGEHNMGTVMVWVSENGKLYQDVLRFQKIRWKKEGLPTDIGKGSIRSVFVSSFEALETLCKIYSKEEFFKQEVQYYRSIQKEPSQVKKWLSKHKEIALEGLWDFWIEWVEEEQCVIRPFILNWEGPAIKIPLMELENAMNFSKVFHEEYWE